MEIGKGGTQMGGAHLEKIKEQWVNIAQVRWRVRPLPKYEWK